MAVKWHICRRIYIKQLNQMVSIVIPTFNRKELLKLCLESLFGQIDSAANVEIIVVDDGSTDDTGHYLMEISRDKEYLKYIRQENSGHSLARKAGFNYAKGDIVISLDDDCVPCGKWLQKIIIKFSTYPDMSICCGTIVNACNSNVAWAQTLIDYSIWMGRSVKKNIPAVYIGNTAYRREALNAGVLQEDGKYLGYRDIMFNHDILQNGYKVIYFPDIIIKHLRWTKIDYKQQKGIFLEGQLRHGRGFASCGYKVFGAMGVFLVRLPKPVYVFCKASIIFIRSLGAGLGIKYICSLRWIILGLWYQAKGIKEYRSFSC